MATTDSTRLPAAPQGERLPFGVLLARLGQESMARFRKALRPLELSAQQYVVLKQLQTMGAASQATLAESLGIDYSNLATVTAELHDAGLIERYRHENDRRRYVVELSGRGAEVVGKAEPGRGARYWVDGKAAPDGECGINTSGGLIAKGHPVGATGVAMIGWAAWQLLGKVPAALQVRNARAAATFNIGGPICASVCTVLKPA